MTEADYSALRTVGNFPDLAVIAIGVLGRMKNAGHQIVQICGPYSTGGLGTKELNAKRFDEAREAAEARGYAVFNQIPFEDAIQRIVATYNLPAGEYCYDILHVFYRTIFESTHITKFLFIPGWESSTGARWERDEAQRLGIVSEDIPLDWFTA